MEAKLIQLPKILDLRGNLSVIEEFNNIPFKIERVYWIYDVPGGESRAGYALRDTDDFVLALSGSFDVVTHDGIESKTIQLNRSYYGLLIPHGLWHEFRNFSTNSLALVLSSRQYDSTQYIRSLEDFILSKQNGEI